MCLCKLLCPKCVLLTQSPFSAQNSTTLLPLSFSHETPKGPVMPVHVLSPTIHLYLPESIIYILSLNYQSSVHVVLFLHHLLHWGRTPHYTNFNSWLLEFNAENSRANTPRFSHSNVPHIVQQNGHHFPSSFHLLNIDNDAINSTPRYLSLPFSF